MRIWTRAYRPFIVGGNVHAPIAINVESTLPLVLLAYNIVLQPVVSPLTGKTYYVETTSGGIVGEDLAQIKADLATAPNRAEVRMQIKEQTELGKSATLVPAAKFWQMLASGDRVEAEEEANERANAAAEERAVEARAEEAT